MKREEIDSVTWPGFYSLEPAVSSRINWGEINFKRAVVKKKETMEDVSLKFPPGGWGRKSMEKGQEMESFARDRTIGKYSLGDEGTE